MVPAVNTATADAGTKFCTGTSGDYRICIKKGRRYDRVCVTFYFSSGGSFTKCRRRYH